jgi:two-component system nitrate/nitrite response regulator NarP
VFTVLIAEDHDTYASVLEERLQGDARIRVLGRARNGAEAIRLADELAPEVVVMDLHMRGISGLAATRAIRAMPDAPRVLVLSASETPGELEVARAAGAEACFHKTDVDDLVEAILNPPLSDG